MAGTKAGGLKAAQTNKILHGEDFYKRIGQKGGQNGHTGGFAANPALAKIAGAKGGRNSRRGPTNRTEKILNHYRDEIITMACDGIYVGTIAGHFGVCKTTLETWLAKNL